MIKMEINNAFSFFSNTLTLWFALQEEANSDLFTSNTGDGPSPSSLDQIYLSFFFIAHPFANNYQVHFGFKDTIPSTSYDYPVHMWDMVQVQEQS
jgi:hypothetical protein